MTDATNAFPFTGVVSLSWISRPTRCRNFVHPRTAPAFQNDKFLGALTANGNMPNEIPDSDEESDFDLPAAPRLPHSSAKQSSSGSVDKGLGVNFDDFISQTQSAKDGSSQLERTKRSTASTEQHLRDAFDVRRGSVESSYDGAGDINRSPRTALTHPSKTGQRKRAHSEIGTEQDQKIPSQKRVKRTRTYGSSARNITFTQEMKDPFEAENVEKSGVLKPSASMSSPHCEIQEPADDDDEDIIPRVRTRPSRVVSLLANAVSTAGHVLSTSNSSMGGYQSYNLDFRGSGPGLDLDANPFGPLSQGPMEMNTDEPGDERGVPLADTVRVDGSSRRPGTDAVSPLTDVGFGLRPTAESSTSIDPSMLTLEPPEDSHAVPEMRLTTARTSSPAFVNILSDDVSQEVDEIECLKNHTKETTLSKKRRRKSQASSQLSVASVQEMLLDQQDDEEQVIGIPKEQYRPRPGKSRAGAIEPQQQSIAEDDPPTKKRGRKKSLKSAPKTAESSPAAKNPSSELNLSDEAIIGLPKENYKPRPSRRRSKMIVEEAEASVEVDPGVAKVNDSPEQQTQTQQSTHIEVQQPDEPPEVKTPKPKRGRKAKMKRAKTSAAALLKKSEPMISDGEEDVIWMDSTPATVKLQVPEDPVGKAALKEETQIEESITVEEKADQLAEASEDSNKEPQISRTKIAVVVEIPAPLETQKPEPKKRGRKRKPIPADEDADDSEADVSEAAVLTTTLAPPSAAAAITTATTVLKEKSTNRTTLTPPTPNQKKLEVATESPSPTRNSSGREGSSSRIIHSPIKPSGGGKVLYRIGLSRRSAIPPLLKIVKPPPQQQAKQLTEKEREKEKENLDEDGNPIDLVAQTMRKWREMGALD